MNVHSPRDLPDFRMWLLAAWRPDGLFGRMETTAQMFGIDADIHNGQRLARNVEGHVERAGLGDAALWWVSAEMSSLIDRASRTLPPTTLTADLLPDDHGLVVFAEPLTGTAADTGEPICVTAMTWHRGAFRWREGVVDALAIGTYRHIDASEPVPRVDVIPQPGAVVTVNGLDYVVVGDAHRDGAWLPTGLNNWSMGADTDDPSVAELAIDANRMASMAEDRRWLAALWLLAAQPLAETTVAQPGRAAARRSQRAQLSSDVRIVNVRRRATDAEREPLPAGGSGRTYTRRWIVEGFWRQQACGPGWKDHRPLFIESHVRGPKDKPLIVRETVKVLRGDP